MSGSNDMPKQPVASTAAVDSAAASGLSDQECVERLQAAVADHDGAPPAGSSPGAGREEDDSSENGQLGEVAALIGRLAVPLEY
jgi:hypothetical protein